MSFINPRLIITSVIVYAMTLSAFAQYSGGDGSGSALYAQTPTTCPLTVYPAIFAGGVDDGYGQSGITQSNCAAVVLPNIFYGGQEAGLTLASTTQSSCIPIVLPSIFTGGSEDGYTYAGITQSNCTPLVLPSIFVGGQGSTNESFQLNTACALRADFIGDTLVVCAGDSVHFTDMSNGAPTSWQWTFTGGNPASSTVQNPAAYYATPGTYSVTLSVSSLSGNNSLTKTNYITVSTPPAVSLSSIPPLCENASNYTLVEGSPAGGTYSGTGVTAGIFNPTIAGTGAHNITYTYTAAGGCTNTATASISVNPTYHFTNFYEMCAGDTYNWHGTNYTSSGVYYANYTSSKGCDSIFTLNLTVHPVYSFTQSHIMCSGDSYTWQGTNYTFPGTYTVNYTTEYGCDSNYTLNLSVRQAYAFSESHTICSGDVFSWHGSNYSSTGTYTLNFNTAGGCDSIYTLNLTVKPVYAFTDNHTMCKGESYTWQGTTYVIAGNYVEDYVTAFGCDSTYTLHLNVNDVDMGTHLINGTISADSAADAYQWLDCDNGYAVISGETFQSFTPPSNGNYAVIITQGACFDTSACTQVTSVGIASENLVGLAMYPNPSDGRFILELDQQAAIEMYNAQGSLVYQASLDKGKHTLSLILADGVYLIKAVNDQGSRTLTLVIRK